MTILLPRQLSKFFGVFFITTGFVCQINFVFAQDFTSRGIQEEIDPTEFCMELNKIIATYPQNFRSLKAESIKRNHYRSQVALPEAEGAIIEEVLDANFDTKFIFKASFKADIPWVEAEQMVLDFVNQIGGCARAGTARFVHGIDDTDRKQVSRFVPTSPTPDFEHLEIRLTLTKVDNNGKIDIWVGDLD